jgi:hypothetical protein
MKHKITLLFLLLTTISFSQIPSYVPSNGLVGWWPFNGNANDESGNGNNGTVNGATLTADRFGVANAAYSFNGIDNYINVINPTELNFPLGVSFTLCFYYMPGSVLIDQMGFNGIISRAYPDFGPAPSTGSWQVGRNASIYRVEASNMYDLSSVGTSWVQMVFVFDRNSGEVKQYIDGVLAQTMNNATIVSEINNDYDLKFGVDRHTYNFVSGSLDDIGIWNRALTEAEIALLYAGCYLSVTTQPQDQSVATSLGTASFSTSVSSTTATYQWQTNLGLGFQSLSNAGQYSGVTSATLTVSGLSLSNNNQVFRCIINDSGCADTTAEAVLTIIDDASIQPHTNTSLQLYPNPVKDIMTLVGLKGDAVSFAVYSVDGKLIKSGQTSGEIQLEDLKKGNYILNIDNQALPFVKL